MQGTPMSANTAPTFHIAQTMMAAPALVFDAWVTPQLMTRWMFVTHSNKIYKAQADLRVGGSWSVLEWTGSEHINHFGHYLQIDRPRSLVFGLQAPKHFAARTQVTVRIDPHPIGSLLTFDQVGIDAGVVETPWRRMFDALAIVLGDPRSAQERQA
jgi:uncharacterized protein YndB with AHSA1/START domain